MDVEDDANSEVDVNKHIQEENEKYIAVVKILETQSMACCHGNTTPFRRVFLSNCRIF